MARTAGNQLRPAEVARLYGAFHRPLAQVVRAGVSAPEEVIEDACQVAWAGLIGQLERVDGQHAGGWLVRAAVREALRLVRVQNRDDSLELELAERGSSARLTSDWGPEELVCRRSQVDSVRALSRRQQRLIWLRALGLSYEEMASHEHCTNRTVRRQLERARRRLRVLEHDQGYLDAA